MASRPIDVAFFNSSKDNQAKPERMEWQDFCEKKLTTPTLVRRGPSREEAKKGLSAFSIAKYDPGALRSSKNVQWLDALVFDVDQSKDAPESSFFTIPQFQQILSAKRIEGWIYETFSSISSCPKFRVILPTAAPVLPLDWPQYVDEALKYLGLDSPRIMAALDLKATKDIARLWFLPAVWEPES